MNWTAVAIAFGLVMIQGLFAWWNGTLTRSHGRKIHMPFLYHGGMWSDAFIMPFVIGLTVDHIDTKFNVWSWLIAGAALLTITVLLHAAWGANPRRRYEEHMWTRTYNNHPILDLNMSGIVHIIFMAGSLTIVTLFLFSSNSPRFNLWATAFLLTLHWPIAVLLPGWVKRGNWLDPATILGTIGLISSTWSFALYKIYH